MASYDTNANDGAAISTVPTRGFLSLPPELLAMITAYLDLGSFGFLLLTSRRLHTFVTSLQASSTLTLHVNEAFPLLETIVTISTSRPTGTPLIRRVTFNMNGLDPTAIYYYHKHLLDARLGVFYDLLPNLERIVIDFTGTNTCISTSKPIANRSMGPVTVFIPLILSSIGARSRVINVVVHTSFYGNGDWLTIERGRAPRTDAADMAFYNILFVNGQVCLFTHGYFGSPFHYRRYYLSSRRAEVEGPGIKIKYRPGPPRKASQTRKSIWRRIVDRLRGVSSENAGRELYCPIYLFHSLASAVRLTTLHLEGVRIMDGVDRINYGEAKTRRNSIWSFGPIHANSRLAGLLLLQRRWLTTLVLKNCVLEGNRDARKAVVGWLDVLEQLRGLGWVELGDCRFEDLKDEGVKGPVLVEQARLDMIAMDIMDLEKRALWVFANTAGSGATNTAVRWEIQVDY